MDGYAVVASDTKGAGRKHPRRIRVVGLAAAGAPLGRSLAPGECCRAMTGAPLPLGADAVVKVEDTDGYDEREAVIYAAVEAGQNYAPRGQDLGEGDLVLAAGTRLGSRHVQALASAGCVHVPVITPPRCAVITTGDELVPPQEKPGPGQIRESNNACVRAVMADFGIECAELGTLPDQGSRLREGIAGAMVAHELLILSGGVSKGEKDLVKEALRDCGVTLHFENLHLKPGHPATFGTHPGGAVFALPGNPVAVFVTLNAVFSAGLRRRLGEPSPVPPAAYGKLGFEARRKGDRPMFLPVVLEAPPEAGLPRLLSAAHHGSGDFISLARADALAFLPEDRKKYRAGTVVEILRLAARDTA